MIDLQRGTLQFGHLTVDAALTLGRLRLAETAKRVVENGPWSTWRLATEEWAALLQFRDGQLMEVTLSKVLGTSDRWDSSPERERERHELHKRLLHEQLGSPPFDMDWGTAELIFDQQTGGSSILLRYADTASVQRRR